MGEKIPCPFAVENGASCMDTVQVPGRIRNTFKVTPDELNNEVVDSLEAHKVSTCEKCGKEYTVEFVPE